MELWKKPVLRVPLVLILTGAACRMVRFPMIVLWARIQILRGPDPATGAYEVSSGPIPEIMLALSFLLFWAVGWKFVRGLSRKEIFLSATVMVVWAGLLLALEQLVQAYGSYSMWISRLYATTAAMDWTSQILIRVFDQVSVPVVLPYIFTPYLYLLLGRRKAPAEPAIPETT